MAPCVRYSRARRSARFVRAISALLLGCVACASPDPPPAKAVVVTTPLPSKPVPPAAANPPAPAVVTVAPPVAAQADATAQPPPERSPDPVTRPPLPPAEPVPPPPVRIEAQARRLLVRGNRLYARGEYERAEEVLKEALLLYPFMAEANLALGKVFLIKGSATRDMALVNSARLMFEMARAMDPELREAALLLELFHSRQPETQ